MKKIILLNLCLMLGIAVMANATQSNGLQMKRSFSVVDLCTVSATQSATGTDCQGYPFTVTVTLERSHADCRVARNLALAAAFNQALQAVADIQDECNGPSNP